MSDFTELFSFLSDPREEVRQLAVASVLSLTSSADLLLHFKADNFAPVDQLVTLLNQNAKTTHDAVSALINLTADQEILAHLSTPAFITLVQTLLVPPTSILADLFCMLLNNLSKHVETVKFMLASPTNLDTLLEIFAIANPLPKSAYKNTGEVNTAKYNLNANFHFLSCIFANLTTTLEGQLYVIADSTLLQPRLDRLIISLTSTSAIRRGGAISTLKNIALTHLGQTHILSSPHYLESILLLLCAAKDAHKFTDEENEKMDCGLQLLEDGVEREEDVRLRRMLVEILVCLASSKAGREVMRSRGVYAVVRVMHEGEGDEGIRDEIERVVDLLIRDEEVEKVQCVERIEGVVESDCVGK